MSLNTISRATLAYASYPFIGARNAGRRFGRVPYIPVPVEDYTVATFEPPVPFTPARPSGFPDNAGWHAGPPYPVTQHRIARIPGGLADRGGYVFTAGGRPVHGACHPRKQIINLKPVRDVGHPFLEESKSEPFQVRTPPIRKPPASDIPGGDES